jgi:hypothetical protein
MEGKVLGQPFQTGGHGGRFSGAGGSGNQDKSGRALEPFLQKFHGEAELLHRGDVGLDATKNSAAEAELAVEVNAEADAVLGDVAGIVILSFGRGTAACPEVFHPSSLERGCFHGSNGLAQPHIRNSVFAEEEIRGPKLTASTTEFLNLVHRSTMPKNSGRPRSGKDYFRERID